MITDTDANMMELCFKNGEQHMKEKVLISLDQLDKDFTLDDAYIKYDEVVDMINKL